MADSKISALTASAGVGGSEQIPVNDAGTNKRVTPAQILDYAKGTASTWTAKQTFNLFEAAAGTLTSDTPFVISQTWNNAAVEFTGLKIDVTNTASASSSKVFDLSVGGSTVFNVDRLGNLTTAQSFYFKSSARDEKIYFGVGNNPSIKIDDNGLGTGALLSLQTVATNAIIGTITNYPLSIHINNETNWIFSANLLQQYNGDNPQKHLIFNTYTSATNYERAKFAWESNRFVIGTEAETGTKRGITLDATDLILSSLPTTDPVVAGQLWLDGTALKVSAGA